MTPSRVTDIEKNGCDHAGVAPVEDRVAAVAHDRGIVGI
jgi:hypothetical protein